MTRRSRGARLRNIVRPTPELTGNPRRKGVIQTTRGCHSTLPWWLFILATSVLIGVASGHIAFAVGFPVGDALLYGGKAAATTFPLGIVSYQLLRRRRA